MAYLNNIVSKFDPSNMSAFGTLEASELTPLFQCDFVYGTNTQLWNTAVASGAGAAVDTNVGRLRIQSGTAATSYAYITSRKIVRYRAGQGITARFTPLFTTGQATSTQLWGLGSIVTNAPYDGYFFGYNGTAVGIVRYSGGTPSWVAQTAWNGDKVDGSAGTSFTWNPTFGTPAMIKYPYLGFGDIEFFLLNPVDGRWVLVHTIQYANTTATAQLTNPSTQFIGFTANAGNTTNLTMYCASVGVFLSGPRGFVSNPRWATDRVVTVANTETHVLSIRNATTYNTATNKGMLRLNNISIASTVANQTAVLRFYIGATLSGTTTFTPTKGTTADEGVTITAGNSIASVNTAATITIAASTNYIFNISYTGSGLSVDLTNHEIYVSPGEVLTITGLGTGNVASNVSLNWSEDI